MGTPSLEDIREKSMDEQVAVAERIEEADGVDEVSVFQNWYLEAINEYRDRPIEKPAQFDEGARVRVGLITGEEEETPLTELCGEVQDASPEELVVDVDETDQNYCIDLDSFTATKPSSDGAGNDVAKLVIDSPPWESDYKALTCGLVSPMFYSEYDWVSRGPYRYPPVGFYDNYQSGTSTSDSQEGVDGAGMFE